MQLLTREQFKQQVFARDKNICIVCGAPGVDAHHIMERRLFPDGGYYLDNGVTLCAECHLKAEDTTLSCEKLREKAGILRLVLPEHLEPDFRYDKWGNPVLENGCRLRGELFFEEPVQKMLEHGNVLGLFEERVKYPRTRHLPWSRQKDNDDVMLWDVSSLEGEEVAVTEKLDGEGTTMYRGLIHARSMEPMTGEDRARVKQLHAAIQWDIPEGWRICGENVTARHSIHYRHLESYFYVFSIWNEKNICLSWDETLEWCELLGLTPIRQIYRGPFSQEAVHSAFEAYRERAEEKDEVEGYVVRVTRAFPYAEFGKVVGKWVRKGHVKTTKFWRFEARVYNELAS